MASQQQYSNLIKGFRGLDSQQQMDLMQQSGLSYKELSEMSRSYEATEKLTLKAEIEDLELQLSAAKARLNELNQRGMSKAGKTAYQVATAKTISSKYMV